jgi:hypothetical protein
MRLAFILIDILQHVYVPIRTHESGRHEIRDPRTKYNVTETRYTRSKWLAKNVINDIIEGSYEHSNELSQ